MTLPAMQARSRRATVGWCLFDFANSSYTTLIITVAFAVYFRQVVVNAPDNRGDQLWGFANFIAMLAVALASPLLGALADYSGRKKFFLVATTLVSVAATLLLYWVGPGDVASAMALFILGTFGFEAGYVFYNAFLPDVSTPQTVGRVSGWGWAVGYVGGLLCLMACKPLSRCVPRPWGILKSRMVSRRERTARRSSSGASCGNPRRLDHCGLCAFSLRAMPSRRLRCI